jgi:hypothetical protein
LVIQLENRFSLVYEKNERAEMYPLHEATSLSNRPVESMDAPTPPNTTLNEFVINGAVAGGDDHWIYNVRTSNCQVFVMDNLRGNQISTPAISEFVQQPIEDIVPGFIGQIATGITDAAALWDKFRRGGGDKEKSALETFYLPGTEPAGWRCSGVFGCGFKIPIVSDIPFIGKVVEKEVKKGIRNKGRKMGRSIANDVVDKIYDSFKVSGMVPKDIDSWTRDKAGRLGEYLADKAMDAAGVGAGRLQMGQQFGSGLQMGQQLGSGLQMGQQLGSGGSALDFVRKFVYAAQPWQLRLLTETILKEIMKGKLPAAAGGLVPSLAWQRACGAGQKPWDKMQHIWYGKGGIGIEHWQRRPDEIDERHKDDPGFFEWAQRELKSKHEKERKEREEVAKGPKGWLQHAIALVHKLFKGYTDQDVAQLFDCKAALLEKKHGQNIPCEHRSMRLLMPDENKDCLELASHMLEKYTQKCEAPASGAGGCYGKKNCPCKCR